MLANTDSEMRWLSARCDMHAGMCGYDWLSFSWAFSDVPSPSMDPEGKRPPLRGHEKGTGRLSQHSARVWGLLKAQTHILPYFIFLFLFPLSLPLSLPVFLSWKGRIQHQPTNMGRVAVYGSWYFFPHEWLMFGETPESSDRNLWWTVKHGFVYCFSLWATQTQSYSQLVFAPRHLWTRIVSLKKA